MAAAWGLARLALALHRQMHPGPLGIGTALALAISTAILAFAAPMAVVYTMPYSEALFMALAVWSINMMIERRYLAAAILVMLAGLTRLTAPALIATLAVCAIVELWRYRRDRRTLYPARFPWAALAAPFIGSLGLVGYLAWANAQTSSSGGYFGVQDDGWGSSFDWGVSTWKWLRENTLSIFGNHTSVGYAISSWAMIAVTVLCLASLWPTLSGRVPWQLTSPALFIAAIVLGSGGIMHSRPRLLLLPALLLLLPAIVRAVGWTATRTGWRRFAAATALVTVGALWCAFGLRTSGHMLIEFPYGI